MVWYLILFLSGLTEVNGKPIVYYTAQATVVYIVKQTLSHRDDEIVSYGIPAAQQMH